MFFGTKKIVMAAMVSLAFATSAFAEGGGNNVSAGADSSSGAAATANLNGGDSSSVGLAGLPGGDCSEGTTFGALGVGYGESALNRYCQLAKQVYPAFDRGLISRAEARAYLIASMEGLGFRLEYPVNGVTIVSAMNQPTVPLTPVQDTVVTSGVLMSVQGEWSELSLEQQRAVVGCEMFWNGEKIEGCVYAPVS